MTRGEQHKQQNKFAPSNSYVVRNGETIAIVAQDQNPLIFTYEWTKKDGVKTDDFKAVEVFAKALKGFGENLKTVVASEETQEVAAKARSTAAANSRILASPNSSRDNKWENAANQPMIAIGTELYDLKTLKTSEAPAQTIAAILREQLGIDDAELTRIGDDIAAIGGYLDDYSDVVADTVAGGDKLAKQRDEAAMQLDAIKRVRKDLETIDDYHEFLVAPKAKRIKEQLKKDLASEPHTQDLFGVSNGDIDLTLRTILIALRRSEINDALKAAETMARNVKQVDDPLLLGELTFDATTNQPGVVKIGLTEAFNNLPVKVRESILKSYRAGAGEYEFVARPFSPVSLQLGPAMIYTFTKRPKYDTEATADGKFRIVRTDEGNNLSGQNLAAMLTLTPSSFVNPIFEPNIQVGIAPDKDNAGIFAGLGFVLYRNVYLGGGVAYQQIEELVPGLRERDIIEKADLLKTSKQYKTGFYLAMSVNFKLQ